MELLRLATFVENCRSHQFCIVGCKQQKKRFDVEIYECTEGIDNEMWEEVHSTLNITMHIIKLNQFDVGVSGIRKRQYGVVLDNKRIPIMPLGGPWFQWSLCRRCDKVAEYFFKDQPGDVLDYAKERASRHGPEDKYEKLENEITKFNKQLDSHFKVKQQNSIKIETNHSQTVIDIKQFLIDIKTFLETLADKMITEADKLKKQDEVCFCQMFDLEK